MKLNSNKKEFHISYRTLNTAHKIRVILRRSENMFILLQLESTRKQILKYKKIKETFVPKIILQKYTSQLIDTAFQF